MPRQPLTSRWPLGRTRCSEPVPAGLFTLVARHDDGREQSLELELRPGEVRAVRFEF